MQPLLQVRNLIAFPDSLQGKLEALPSILGPVSTLELAKDFQKSVAVHFARPRQIVDRKNTLHEVRRPFHCLELGNLLRGQFKTCA